jgi:hypothetical protein
LAILFLFINIVLNAKKKDYYGANLKKNMSSILQKEQITAA